MRKTFFYIDDHLLAKIYFSLYYLYSSLLFKNKFCITILPVRHKQTATCSSIVNKLGHLCTGERAIGCYDLEKKQNRAYVNVSVEYIMNYRTKAA